MTTVIPWLTVCCLIFAFTVISTLDVTLQLQFSAITISLQLKFSAITILCNYNSLQLQFSVQFSAITILCNYNSLALQFSAFTIFSVFTIQFTRLEMYLLVSICSSYCNWLLIKPSILKYDLQRKILICSSLLNLYELDQLAANLL